jgi:aldose 1-epimerase
MSVLERDVVALCDGVARCDVVPQAGGSIAGFWWEEGGRRIDWLRPARAADVARGDADAMACYPLVPWAGRIGSSFRFGGEEIVPSSADAPALDGHAWREAWRVARRSAAAVEIEYRHDGGVWPWAYRARQSIAFAEGALVLTLVVTNESDRLMPVGLGFRSVLPFASEATLEAAVQDREKDEPVFAGWDGLAVIAWPGRGRALRLAADWPLLSFLAIRRTECLCLAPMSHCSDAFNLARAGVAGTGLRVLAPGASRSATVKLTPDFSAS